jgi:O-antigen/teichoic acid export membrane protein
MDSKSSKETSKHFLISILALVIGAFNNLFIYSSNVELKGKYDFIVNTGYILAIILGFGLSSLPNKYLVVFKTEDGKDHGFLTSLIVSGLLSCTLALLSFYVLFDLLELGVGSEYQLYWKAILMVGISVVFLQILSRYMNAKGRTALPLFVINLVNKVFIGLLVYLISQGWYSEDYFVKTFVMVFIAEVVILTLSTTLLYGNSLSLFSIQKVSSLLPKEFITFLISGFFLTLSYSILDKIDISMLGAMASFNDTGKYGILQYITAIVLIPYIGIISLYGRIIADHMHQKEFEQVSKIYKNTSAYLQVIGLLLFLTIWANLPVLSYLSPKMQPIIIHRDVILILAIGHLVNMVFGVNEHIISYGRYFIYNVAFVLGAIILNILLNYALIPTWSIKGAAIATTFTLVLFNVAKSYFIRVKYGMNVISRKVIFTFIVGMTFVGIIYWFNIDYNVTSFIISNFLVIAFWILSVRLDFSQNFTTLNHKYWAKLKLFFA